MFITHLPAGYLATRSILRRHPVTEPLRSRLLALGMAASVPPDLDLLWFVMAHVPARHEPWVLNSVLHWTFALELAILAAALLVARRTGRARSRAAPAD